MGWVNLQAVDPHTVLPQWNKSRKMLHYQTPWKGEQCREVHQTLSVPFSFWGTGCIILLTRQAHVIAGYAKREHTGCVTTVDLNQKLRYYKIVSAHIVQEQLLWEDKSPDEKWLSDDFNSNPGITQWGLAAFSACLYQFNALLLSYGNTGSHPLTWGNLQINVLVLIIINGLVETGNEVIN